ncbi:MULTISPECIES: fasciclin domain-containing protein [unclassified Nocardioides]|uniref:fasciclin domain-containing protein n=1 Tax=unclassified Nocardioides TaxID=2615069 RepID=UPI000702C395|nr:MULTISPECIES: fasciclin domain-containing protein [unclassified Nocardioides]KQZ75980.1 beta-Ig-H3/fasciclin [Nocardioides sp. Root151]KRF15053.1 beta-Ig-H3/fasciclin [Nocardioides sp. Soil796]
MKRSIIRQTGIAAAALALSVSLAACGSDDNGGDDKTTAEDTPSQTESSASSDDMADDAGAETFGAGCAKIPTSGAGSFNGMATEPVATAASANPLLETLVTAVGEAGLGDTLNSAEALTVFAPTNDAFAKIPADTLKGVLADKATLTKILTHHVIAGQLGPDELAGKHKTLAGDTIMVKGSGEDFTVGGENAAVLCGNIPTANATVYVVDSVLMPAS